MLSVKYEFDRLTVEDATIKGQKEAVMKVYKKRLPEGVKKQFALEKGIKVKILNSLYFDKKKKKNK